MTYAAMSAMQSDPEKFDQESIIKGGDSPNTSASTLNLPQHDQSQNNFNARDAASPQEPPRKAKGIVWALIVLAMLSSTFLFALDQTITANIQPAIVRRFNSVDKLAWISVAFLCGSASASLTWGQIYSHFEAKTVYLICIAIFQVGSAVCGASPTMNALIVGRAICGLGGAGMYTGVMVLLTVTTLEQERSQYFGLCGLTWGLGTVLGPIIGGALSDSSATWRWAFYINLCIGGLFAPILLFLIPTSDPSPGTTFLTRAKRIDWLGTIILCGFFVSGLMAISFGGAQYAWNSGAVIACFVVSGVLCIVFFAQQTFKVGTTFETRLFPLDMFKSKIVAIMFLATACGAVAIFVPTYFIPLYFQFVRGVDALTSGVRLLPYIVFSAVFAIVSGGFLSKLPYYLPWFIFGPVLLVIGGACMFTVNTGTSVAHVYGYSILMGAGTGAFCQLPFTIVQCKVDRMRARTATGLLTFAQVAAPAVAMAIADAIFLNLATNRILGLGVSATRSEVQQYISGLSVPSMQNLSTDLKQRCVEAILYALEQPFSLIITSGGLVLISCLFMKMERLF